jgi:hypothetical protein
MISIQEGSGDGSVEHPYVILSTKRLWTEWDYQQEKESKERERLEEEEIRRLNEESR